MTRTDSHRVFYRRAHSVLAQYNLHPVQVQLLSAKEHTVFHVAATTHAGGLERFALRMYDPLVFDGASVQTEIEWLGALRRDAGLAVPEPVAARSGAPIVYSSLGDSGITLASVLFRWVNGRRRTASLSPKALEQVGAFTARLHLFSERFRPSVGTVAQQWNWERVFGGTSIVGVEVSSPLFSPEQQHLFRCIARTMRRVMEELGQSPQVWGLIHADLHASNYLFQGDRVGAIDFEDCGWGYYLYDLAVILDEVYAAYAPRAERFRAALLQGYTQVRPLPHEHMRHLDTFIAMRLAELVRWHGTSTNTNHHASVAQLITETMAFVEQRQLCWYT